MNMHLEPASRTEPAVRERIPAHTKRQAMDWSLVLASQGIEPVIDCSAEAGWGLVVATHDYEKAVEAIGQYRVENLHWPRRKPVLRNRLLFDWGNLAWVLLVATFFWLSETRANLRDLGMMDGAAVAGGQWWRLFTAVLLHADLGHLAGNAGIGLVLLGLAMGHYGTGVGLLAAFLAGAGGNMASWLVHSETHRSLGASGMVMGALGLLAAQSVSLRREFPNATRHVASGIAAGIMLFVLLGLSPGTDVVAHFGGFAIGLLTGAALTLLRDFTHRRLVNLTAALLFAALVIWTWALALRANG